MNKDVQLCECCNNVRTKAWFGKTTPTVCAICMANNPEYVPVKVVHHEAEVIEDTGCAGGACTL